MTVVKKFDEIGYTQQVAVRDEFVTFIKTGSLYQKHSFDVLPNQFKQVLPTSPLWLHCNNCGRETPFEKESYQIRAQPEADVSSDTNRAYGKDLESRVYVIGLDCTNCKIEEIIYWIEVDKKLRQARKVGQVPEPTITVPADLRKALGDDDIELYRRAKICTNLSYGIAACIYLRRLLENRITPLLRVIEQARRDEGADEDQLRKIVEIREGKIAEKKIELASEILPESLRAEGDNALKLAYDELSFGIHSLGDNDCVELARRTFVILDRMLVELAFEQKRRESKQEFDSTIRELRKEKTRREKST